MTEEELFPPVTLADLRTTARRLARRTGAAKFCREAVKLSEAEFAALRINGKLRTSLTLIRSLTTGADRWEERIASAEAERAAEYEAATPEVRSYMDSLTNLSDAELASLERSLLAQEAAERAADSAAAERALDSSVAPGTSQQPSAAVLEAPETVPLTPVEPKPTNVVPIRRDLDLDWCWPKAFGVDRKPFWIGGDPTGYGR